MSTFNENSIKRSGRTSSQRSIYDYPEHLNPFYEDENHKRLRFWKLNSENNNSKNKKSRSNSFSFDGLKGLWSFKSFRLKKKSSTLGINKTSESPPMLRRDDDTYNYSTPMDTQVRHTIDVGLANNFQRGAPYRSSLQDLNSRDQQVLFVRNHRYRNTVQNGNLASQSQLRASTPALQTRYVRPALSRGSSQTSVNSTNPFEDDYMDTVSQAESVGGLSITRSGRKKRRAPQPPTSLTKNVADKSVIAEESSGEVATDGKCDDSVNIISLTAEIQSFVKIAAHDADEGHKNNQSKPNEEVEPTTKEEDTNQMRQSPESNDFYVSEGHASSQNDELTFDKIQNLGVAGDYELVNNYERVKSSPVKILIQQPTEEDNESESASNEPGEEPNTNKMIDATDIALPDALDNKDLDNKPLENKDQHDDFEPMADDSRNECNTPTSQEVENILESQNRYSINSTSTSLRITESYEDLPAQANATSNFEVVNIPLEISPLESPKSEVKEELSTINSRFEIRTVPLKNFSPEPIRKSSVSHIETNGTAAKEAPPTPPRRNRTVKEIIESINKSQSLLKINQDKNESKDKLTTENGISQTSLTTQKNSNEVDRNLNESTAKNYYQQKKLFAEVAEENGNKSLINDDNDDDNIPLCLARYNEVSKNNSILFNKCTGARNKNVHSANRAHEKSTNVEWNPVPKPRRHKHSP